LRLLTLYHPHDVRHGDTAIIIQVIEGIKSLIPLAGVPQIGDFVNIIIADLVIPVEIMGAQRHMHQAKKNLFCNYLFLLDAAG